MACIKNHPMTESKRFTFLNQNANKQNIDTMHTLCQTSLFLKEYDIAINAINKAFIMRIEYGSFATIVLVSAVNIGNTTISMMQINATRKTIVVELFLISLKSATALIR